MKGNIKGYPNSMMQNESWICFFGDAANSFSYDIIAVRLCDIVQQVANGQ